MAPPWRFATKTACVTDITAVHAVAAADGHRRQPAVLLAACGPNVHAYRLSDGTLLDAHAALDGSRVHGLCSTPLVLPSGESGGTATALVDWLVGVHGDRQFQVGQMRCLPAVPLDAASSITVCHLASCQLHSRRLGTPGDGLCSAAHHGTMLMQQYNAHVSFNTVKHILSSRADRSLHVCATAARWSRRCSACRVIRRRSCDCTYRQQAPVVALPPPRNRWSPRLRGCRPARAPAACTRGS